MFSCPIDRRHCTRRLLTSPRCPTPRVMTVTGYNSDNSRMFGYDLYQTHDLAIYDPIGSQGFNRKRNNAGIRDQVATLFQTANKILVAPLLTCGAP